MKPETYIKTARSRNQSKLEAAAGPKNLDRPKILLISRLLLNDQLWSQGDVIVVEAGRPIQLTPRFQSRGGPLLQSGELPLTHY